MEKKTETNAAARGTVQLPLLPLRGVVAFPEMLLNFEVERAMSVAALNSALGENQSILLLAQKDITTVLPKAEDLYTIGTVCTIRQVLRVPGSSLVKVMVEGEYRARVLEIRETGNSFTATVERIETRESRLSKPKAEALIRRALTLLEEYVGLTDTSVPETVLSLIDSVDMGRVADFVAQTILPKHTEKQLILEELRPHRRIELVNRMVSREINVQALERDLDEGTKAEMDHAQRDYYLREQMKVIRQELGEGEEESAEELEDYRRRIRAVQFAPEVEEKLLKEVARLARQPFSSAEGAVIRDYLDQVLSMPWNERTKDTVSVARARKCLDEDHYGLDKVKERIVEFLAVRQLAPEVKGGVLCLVGPPGVGKTSVAMSVARATNRKLARISLGGVHDEAEIRGHRKTYIGAMPGRIAAGIAQAKSMNPVMVLDEIDKVGSDFKGDPSAALLEALDAEQNGCFRDHYLELPLDLSNVLFICTANTLDTIPRALLDRMEVIELSSYTDEEKLQIAKAHLLPKQRRKHGLRAAQLKLSDDAIRELISDYTRESGVRVLERELAALCRKTARMIADGARKSLSLHAGQLEPYLGVPRYQNAALAARDEVGLVHGLAWTAVGGEVLDVEVSVMDGSGKLELTGNLGDVMKESARAAVTYIRTRTAKLGIDPKFYETKDLHIHFPEGAVPKDGPSAGITICMALISALTGVPARHDVCMTGEISLRGRVMPIGGLREKTMAALRNDIHTVILPAENEKDLEEIDPLVRKALNFITADHVDQVIDLVLRREEPAEDAARPIPVAEAKDHAKLNIRQ